MISAQLIADTVLLGGLYSILAVGMSLAFGVTRIINFAHGEFVMLGAYAAFWLFRLAGIDPLVSLPLVAAAGFGLGWAVFALTIRRILRARAVNQILLTFGIGLVLQNTALMGFSGNIRSTEPSYALSSIELGPVILPVGSLAALALAIVAFVGLYFWLDRTELGRASQAVAENEVAARLVGIDVPFVYGLVFAISAGLAAAAGAVVSFLIPVSPFMGFSLVIRVFAIVILGGMGSIAGSAMGAFVLAAVETVVAYDVPDGSGWAEGAAFAALLVVLIFRPQGIVGGAAH